jgi:radical SAM protein with 4Fe4S-binding SPASM domain
MSHLEITTILPCTNACKFCPQEVLLEAYGDNNPELDFWTFGLLLDKIPKDVQIHFSGFSEPFLNRSSSLMMAHAYRMGYKLSLYSTLVGLIYNDLYFLKGIEFDGITIHVPDDWNFTVDNIDDWLVNYNVFASYFKIDSAAYYIGNADDKISKRFHKADNHCLTSRCNNVNRDVIPRVKRITGNINCVSGGHAPVLLPNGDVVICCMDWGLKHKLGNLCSDSWEDLFNSEKFKKVQASWADESIETICRYCRR